MKSSIANAGLLFAALLLAGCNETLEDISPKASKPLPSELTQSMQAKGMVSTSSIMIRIFKEEAKLEVWKQKSNGRYDLAASYDICKWSGKLGPKFTEGDRQAPEGFYFVRPHQMNPRSSYHLAFNLGFPNTYDRVHGRTGQHLMVHGACSSAGCYSMDDPQIEQIYAFAREAFKGGQESFQVQAFPFRMTPQNMARYSDDPNYEFWTMLKEGYDHFEITKVPPKVDVCAKRYVFNQVALDGQGFDPAAACPATTRPETLELAYRSYQTKYDTAFTAANSVMMKPAAAPTIAGYKEATLVADWSKRRARGERVTREPPSLERPEVLMAEKPQPPKLEQTVAAVPTPAPDEQIAAVPSEDPAKRSASPLAALWPIKRGGAAEAATEAPASVPGTETAPATAAPTAPEPAPTVVQQAKAAPTADDAEAPAAVEEAVPASVAPSGASAGGLPSLGLRKLRNIFGN
jgi:murein L,D-transpeptidase YafK